MRLVVLTSGGGILQTIQDAIGAKRLNAEIVLAVLAQPQPSEQLHTSPTIATLAIPPDLEAETQAHVAQKILAHQPDLIVLENETNVFSATFLAQLSPCIMTLHPALPGEFLGADAIGDAYDAFQRGDILNSGITIYLLTPSLNTKEVVLKAGIPMLIEDTLEDFETRMFAIGQQLLIKALTAYAAKYHSANGS